MIQRLLIFFLILVVSPAAYAACSGTTNGVPATAAYMIANDFQNGRPAGSITPDCIRDLIASGAGNAQTFVNLKNLGGGVGGDDTTLINNALAAALPSTFTGTGSVAGTSTTNAVLTITAISGTPILLGQAISGTNVQDGTKIASFGTGTGGTGTYNVTFPPVTPTGSETITFHPPPTAQVYLPTGLYLHTGLIQNPGVVMFGDGATATELRATDAAGTSCQSAGPCLAVYLSGIGPELRQMAITSTYMPSSGRLGQGDSQAVFINPTAVDWTVADNTVRGGAAAGIIAFGASRGRVYNNQIFDTLADGLHNCCGSHDNLWLNNTEYRIGDDCFANISYDNTAGDIVHDVTWIGNTCDTSFGGRGLSAEGGYNLQFIGNTVKNIYAMCIGFVADEGFGNGSDMTAIGNNIVGPCGWGNGNPAAGIWGGTSVTSLKRVKLIGNTFSNLFGITTAHGIGVRIGIPGSGSLASLTTDIDITDNDFLFPGPFPGPAVDMWYGTTVNVENNMIQGPTAFPISTEGAGPGAGMVGQLNIIGNSCIGTGVGTSYCIWVGDNTITGLTVRNNMQRNAGTTLTAFLFVNGPANATIDGNWPDNTTYTLSGITHGVFDNGVLTRFGTPTSCTSQPTGTLWNSSGTIHIC